MTENEPSPALIRKAFPDDAEAVSAILCEAFPSLYVSTFGLTNPALLLALVTRLYRAGHLPLEHTLVAEREGRIVGAAVLNLGEPLGNGPLLSYVRTVRKGLPFFASVRAVLGGLLTEYFLDSRIPRAPDLLYIEALAISEGARGQGIGSQLLQSSENLARSLSRRRLSLHVLRRNTGAERLYERFGFRKAPTGKPLRFLERLSSPFARWRNPENRWATFLMEKRLSSGERESE